uniref:Uncharacterized protein n=1 Tax=Lutzomyia longipalpis TaxID=7200 RepID=A0A7G3B691_LUTLO
MQHFLLIIFSLPLALKPNLFAHKYSLFNRLIFILFISFVYRGCPNVNAKFKLNSSLQIFGLECLEFLTIFRSSFLFLIKTIFFILSWKYLRKFEFA